MYGVTRNYEVARVYDDGPKYVVRERESGKWLTKPTTQREFAARGFSVKEAVAREGLGRETE